MKFIPAACLALLLPWGCAQAGQACHPARGAAFGLRLCGDDGTSNTGLSIFVAGGRVTRAVLYGYGP